MKRIIRLTAVCLAVLLVCTAFAGCFGTGKKMPEKEVVDHVYKYSEKELISVENPDYDSEEEFTGRSYIDYTSVDADGYMYTINTMDSNYTMTSQIAYMGRFDSEEVTQISLPVVESEDLYRGIQNIIRLDDGILTTVYENKVIDAENGVWEQNNYAEIYNTDGTVRATLDFKKILGMEGEDNYLNIGEICFAGGDLFMTLYTDLEEYNNKLIRLGLDGTIKETIALLPEGVDGYVGSIRALGDSKICAPVETYSDSSYSQKLLIIDLTTGEKTEVDAGNDYRIMYQSFGGSDGNLYYSGDSGINLVDPGTGESTELMNYINSDYIYNYGSTFYAINSEKFVSLKSEYEDEKTTLSVCTFEKVPDEQLVPKYLITVASAGGSYNFREQIVEFNLASEEYRIKYIDYSQYNTEDDYTAGQTKLQNDIIAGNVPDVLITDQEFSASKYANKGLFVDLYTYMDNDPKLPRSAFLENVLTACETNGKLYEIPTNIYILGFMGYKDTIGEFANLTMREFYEKVQALPEGVSFFREGDYTRDDMLETMFFLNYVNFIDPTTGLCDLNNDDFKAMLEYVATLPEKTKYEMDDFDWETYDYEAYENMFKEGKAIAEWTSLNSFTSFANYSYSFGDKDLDFIGAPAPDRDGMVFSATNLRFLISAKGNFPDQAWEFVKVFFTEENQRDLSWGFPVIKSALEAEKQEALDDIAKREAEEANKEDGDSDSIGSSTTGIITSDGVIIQEAYPMYEERYATREDVETIYNYITHVKKQLMYDSSILDIIKEEASEYFAGKKSLDDVAAQAQSRVNIKLGEAR